MLIIVVVLIEVVASLHLLALERVHLLLRLDGELVEVLSRVAQHRAQHLLRAE